ncbi:MAG TPA: pirin family protein [Burkholderiaceae bacterium]
MRAPERISAKTGDVGGLPIRRALPSTGRRRIGAWCFLDHAGPATLTAPGMRVGPHPHTGLQTFSWLIEGEILHRDSLGSEQVLRAGQINLMTAGRGISHSEESLSERLHLAQLWIALPDAVRHCEPRFEHFATLPQQSLGGFDLTLLQGSFAGQTSPVPAASPLLGIDLACASAAANEFALDPSFEHGVMVLDGALEIEGEHVEPGTLLYFAPGTERIIVRGSGPARALLLGGAPLEEPVLLWWNFVARTGEEVAQYTAEWNAGDAKFGEVHGFEGPRLLAPDLAGLHLKGSI